jgi:hypothetical protein
MRVIAARSKFFYQRLKTLRTGPRAYSRIWIRIALPLRPGVASTSVRSTEMTKRSSPNDCRELGVTSNPPDLNKNPRDLNGVFFYVGILNKVGISYALPSAK